MHKHSLFKTSIFDAWPIMRLSVVIPELIHSRTFGSMTVHGTRRSTRGASMMRPLLHLMRLLAR